MHEYKGTPKIGVLGPAPTGGGVWLSPKNKPLSIYVTMSIMVVLHQRMYTEVEGNPRNWGALGPHPSGGV